ncbi:UNVERIFIED_CONTAM: Ubiquinol oxidase, mitochondrial [Sesamum radiatum]|uniref:Ubiquinol oxidase n=1 Tax=Sesamum radiatum TaxID=300843 RepID=A0AAW2LL23_SESRA
MPSLYFTCCPPKLAHRIVGYLEEEAIYSYTEFLKDIYNGAIENVPAPAIAIDYWRLPKDATLKDVISFIRADEEHHQDVNHFASVSSPGYSLPGEGIERCTSSYWISLRSVHMGPGAGVFILLVSGWKSSHLMLFS